MENNIRHKHFSGRAIMLAASLLWATLLPSVVAETPRINLQNTEIRTLVEAVSKVTGKNFVIDPAVRGNVTFVSGEGLSEDQFYEAFLSILQVHGFEAIDAGNVTKIVPINKARSQVAPIIQGTPEKPAPRVDVDETVTQVFPLQYIPVNTAIQTLQPLAGQGETRIQFNQSSNAVIVTGRGQNVQRLAEVIRQIDVPNNQDFELVALRYSVA
ncbi:MAG TPA: secretin N-terminal domain-containing protein, partial [Thiolinea sp.]|nr:secretin N-terminal domain-containing protein [Thiolinea sp.]